MAPALFPPGIARQRGVTLTELMIALVLSALVVLAATAMVVTSRGTYRSQDEGTRLAESARFGLELSNRMVRLAGYTNFGDDPFTPAAYTPDPTWVLSPDSYALNGPNIVGSNNSKPGGGSGLNNSDSLTIRYFGASTPAGTADGNILDCAGFSVPQPINPAVGEDAAPLYRNSRAYNVLFVDADVDGEPALKCRRQTYDAAGVPSGTGGDTQTLIRGVESFQVLYGEALYPNVPPNDPDLVPPINLVYRTGIGGVNPVVNWNNVITVRIAMLLRSAPGARPDVEDPAKVYHLFGDAYAAVSSDADFRLSALSTSERTRVRRVVETTVFVRNRLASWPSLDEINLN